MAPSGDAPNRETLDELFFLLNNSSSNSASNNNAFTDSSMQGPATLPPVAGIPRDMVTNQMIQPVSTREAMDKWSQPFHSTPGFESSSSSPRPKKEERHQDSTTERKNDVLLGRGKAYYRHPGNVRFRRLISDLSPSYEATGVNGKYIIRENIVEQIHRNGGRFLKHAGAAWEIASDKEAMDKVAHGFRALRGSKGGGNEKGPSSLQRKTSQSSTSSSVAKDDGDGYDFDDACVARKNHHEDDHGKC